MKNFKSFLIIATLLMAESIGLKAYAYETASAVPNGIAVTSGAVEVSFPTMENPEGCYMSGAYIITTDAGTRKQMLAVLLFAKATNTPVRVRLSGCTDRPIITYVFLDADWI